MTLTTLPRKALVAASLATCFSAAHATNGYFAHGYGVKAQGMGGAAVAMTDNAFAGANNPATAAFAGNRWDLGATVFSPRRSVSRGDAGPFGGAFSVDSDKEFFLIPEFGYNVALSNKIGLNLTVYGNGGMNTEYPTVSALNGSNSLYGTGKLGVDLMQLIVAPTFAYKFTDNSAIGVSPLLVYQRFKAYGLQAFAAAPPNGYGATSLAENNGTDSSTGFGVRVGYMAKLNDKVNFGMAYSPKVDMKEFDKYRELFAEKGDFDIPENYSVGLAIQATPTVVLALDYQRINYSGVASVSNPSTNQAALGASNGPGFGWKDINVYKLGVQWQKDATWTLRAGYNRGENPISSRDVTFNILAPGVMKDHYTFGATMALNKTDEISFFGMYAPEVEVSGTSLLVPGVRETIRMNQYSGGIQFSRKF